MWLLSGFLAFVWLQGFQPLDATLFNTFVTALSKSLAHQASVSASHTAFIGLKRRQFYLPLAGLLFGRKQAGFIVFSASLFEFVVC